MLAAIGICLYCFNRFVTFIDGTAKQVINWVVIGVMVFIVLQAVGVLDLFKTVQVPRLTR